MKIQTFKLQRTYLIILFLFTWFALITQFYINISSQTAPVPEIIIRYVSYFTITTNLIVALCVTFLLWKPDVKLTSFFSKQSTQTAVAVYIFIVGLIYNTNLRFIWNPQGIQRVVDELLHLIIPVSFLGYWFLFSIIEPLKLKTLLPWLLYPLAYILFVMVRSNWSGFYPYPFLNVTTLGPQAVFINCIGITLLFIIVSYLFITIGNYMAKRK